MRFYYRTILILFVTLCSVSLASAQNSTIKVNIKNGTTGAESIGLESVWVSGFETGMISMVAEKKNVKGETTFSGLSPSTQAPYLVQTLYKGVTYKTSVNVATASENHTVDLTVYEPTKDVGGIVLRDSQIHFKMVGNDLQVIKIYFVHNESNPPRTVFDEAGSFKFYIPPTSNGIGFTTINSGLVPLDQTAIETPEENIFAIEYPLQPGITEVQLGYSIHYEDKKFVLNEYNVYNSDSIFVVAQPTDISISAEKLIEVENNQQRGFRVLKIVETFAAGSTFNLSLQGGTAIVAPNDDIHNNTGGGGFRVIVQPNRFAKAKWAIIVATFIILGMGIALSRNRAPVKESGGKGTPQKLIAKKNELLKELAALDDSFVANGTNKSDYQRKRGILKTKLVEVFKKIEKHS